MVIKSIALALFLLVSGCYDVRQIPADSRVSVSREFSDDQKAAVIRGLDAWQIAANGKLDLDIHLSSDRSADLTIEPADLGNRNKIGLCAMSGGQAVIQLDVMYIEAHEPPDTVQAATMHEMGHALGLHGHSETGLMIAKGFPGLVIDADTLARFNENYQ